MSINDDKMKELFYIAYDSLVIKEFSSYQEQLTYENEEIIPKIIDYFNYYKKKCSLGIVLYPDLFILLIAHLFRRIIDSQKQEFEWNFLKEQRDGTLVIKDSKIVSEIFDMIKITIVNTHGTVDLSLLFLQLEYADGFVKNDDKDYFKWNFGIKKTCVDFLTSVHIGMAFAVMDSNDLNMDNKYDTGIRKINKIIIRDVSDQSNLIDNDLAKQMALVIIDYVTIYMILNEEEIKEITDTIRKLGGDKMVNLFITKLNNVRDNLNNSGYKSSSGRI